MKKILLSIGVVAIIFVLVLITAIIYLLNNYQNTKTRGKEPVSELSQFHSKNGYTITYPKNWTVDDSQTSAPALFKIKSLPEVVKYEADLKKAGSKASFEVQDDDAHWSIQVFEIVKNGSEPSHTATFGWYTVDKKTGAVEKEL